MNDSLICRITNTYTAHLISNVYYRWVEISKGCSRAKGFGSNDEVIVKSGAYFKGLEQSFYKKGNFRETLGYLYYSRRRLC